MKNQTAERPPAIWEQPIAWLLVLAIAVFLVAAWIVFKYNTDFHDEDASVARATWVLALFTFALAVGIPVTIWDSSKRALEQEQDQFYAQLDAMYLEIQKIVIEYPHLGHPAALLKNPEANPEHATQYDAFAFVIWNFIESIHDFTRKGARRKTEMLTHTWECIIDYEGARHAHWFVRPENEHKFKRSFRNYMKPKLDLWTAMPSPASSR